MLFGDDDFVDEYLEYKLFEKSLKESEAKRKARQGKPTSPPPMRMTKKSSDLGCGGWIVPIIMVVAAISIFGSCGKSSHKSNSSSSYWNSYSTSSRSSTSRSTSTSSSSTSSKPSTSNTYKSYISSSKSKSKSSSDPYDAKSYAHPDDLYYDYPVDFWDYKDVEDYWEEHQD